MPVHEQILIGLLLWKSCCSAMGHRAARYECATDAVMVDTAARCSSYHQALRDGTHLRTRRSGVSIQPEETS